jgi:hypothetical protein
VDTRLKEHQLHIRLEHLDKSPVAEYSIDLGQCIQLHNTSILATKTRHMDHIIREGIEIELHPNNMKRKGGFCLSNSWKSPSAPTRNLLNMMPDLQGCIDQCTLSSSGPEATGSMLAW